MMFGIMSVMPTTMIPMVFGRRCRKICLNADAPSVSLAMMNSWHFSCRMSPRVVRAALIHP
jgi:hypothetical protein